MDINWLWFSQNFIGKSKTSYFFSLSFFFPTYYFKTIFPNKVLRILKSFTLDISMAVFSMFKHPITTNLGK